VVKLPDQKILVLDIEWRPTLAYVWRAWDENVSPEQIVEHGGLLCVGAKWLGQKTQIFSEWKHGHKGMLERVHEMMSYADVIIGFNSDKFDLPKLHGEFLLHGLDPAPPCTSIDCIKAVKKFGFFRNSLAFIGPFLGVGAKLEHEGFALWKKVMKGDKDAQKRMENYCIQDVDMTAELYLKIRSHIKNHPHLGRTGAEQCPVCGSTHTQKRGTQQVKEKEVTAKGTIRTRCYKKQRHQCQAEGCGHWFLGRATKI